MAAPERRDHDVARCALVFAERDADGRRRWRVTIDGGATLDAGWFDDFDHAAAFAAFMAERVAIAGDDDDKAE